MNDSSLIRSEILEKNRQLHEKVKKAQNSFDSKLQKSLKNFMEIEVPKIKSAIEMEVKEALKEHEHQINILLSKLQKIDAPSIDFSQNKSRFSSNVEEYASQNFRTIKERYKENRIFGENTKRFKDSFKDSLNLSQKNSLRNEEDSKEIFKHSMREIKSTKNATKPESLFLARDKEMDLRKRFEKFKKADSSSSSSSLSSKSSEDNNNKKKAKKKPERKENSFVDSSSSSD